MPPHGAWRVRVLFPHAPKVKLNRGHLHCRASAKDASFHCCSDTDPLQLATIAALCLCPRPPWLWLNFLNSSLACLLTLKARHLGCIGVSTAAMMASANVAKRERRLEVGGRPSVGRLRKSLHDFESLSPIESEKSEPRVRKFLSRMSIERGPISWASVSRQ